MQDFKPKKKHHSHLLMRTRPEEDPDLVPYVCPNGEFEVFIHRVVLSQIHSDAARAVPDETIGLLAGRVWRDEKGAYTLVLAAKGAVRDEIDATPSHVRISGGDLSQVRQRLEIDNPAMEIVGWYHSHPTFRPSFSSVDVTEQSTWSDPNHIGIVYSGLPGEPLPYGVYRGPDAVKLTPKKAITLGYHLPSMRREPYHLSPAIRQDAKAECPTVRDRAEEPAKSEPTTALSRATDTYFSRMKTANPGVTGTLVSWIVALGVIGLVASTLLVSHRVNAIEDQLSRLLRDGHLGAELRKDPSASSKEVLQSTEQTSQRVGRQGSGPNEPNRTEADLPGSPPSVQQPRRARRLRALQAAGRASLSRQSANANKNVPNPASQKVVPKSPDQP